MCLGLLCSATCEASSQMHPVLGCSFLLDSKLLTSWSSAYSESPPHTLRFDIPEQKSLYAYSLEFPDCEACLKDETPKS